MIKIASFNVENLFERPKVFNFKDHSIGDDILEKVNDLRSILDNVRYTDSNKDKILKLYEELKEYIIIREDRGKLFKKSGWKVVGVKANGVGQWDGGIEFKKARYNKIARDNTARVIKDVNADIACVIEADNRIALKRFDTALLNSRYPYEMLIDGNDSRGIDVGVLSKFNFGAIQTHIYDKINPSDRSKIFSRDCLEIEVKITSRTSIYFLINHFKSKGYDTNGKADERRKSQSTRVAEILKKYDLKKDYVIVAGDLNDIPNSDPLNPLMKLRDMHDVLELQYGDEMSKRWTYHYRSFEQIDYLLISTKLKEKFVDAGVERRGIYNLKKLTTDSNGTVPVEEQYDDVTHWTNQASDHGAVWVKLDL